jgi:hypothetical protein
MIFDFDGHTVECGLDLRRQFAAQFFVVEVGVKIGEDRPAWL